MRHHLTVTCNAQIAQARLTVSFFFSLANSTRGTEGREGRPPKDKSRGRPPQDNPLDPAHG